MNNTGIEDEVIEAWAGQRNGMAEKTKSKNFNWCAFWFGGYYFLYRKMYLIGIIDIVLSTIANIIIMTILIGFEAITYRELELFWLLAVFVVPIINGFLFYPLYIMHIKNTLRKNTNRDIAPVQVASLNGGVNAGAVGIAIAIIFAISTTIIIFLVSIGIAFASFYNNYYSTDNYYDRYDYDDYYDRYDYDDYEDRYYDMYHDINDIYKFDI